MRCRTNQNVRVLQAELSGECVFRENIGLDHYNTYTSVRYSNSKKTLYMGLDGRGLPRRVQVPTLRHKRQQFEAGAAPPPGGKLGRLATYARVLTRHVPSARMEEVARRLLLLRQRLQLGEEAGGEGGEETLRHHGYAHLCPAHAGLVTPPPPPPRKCIGRVGAGVGAVAPKRPQPKRKNKKCSEEEDIEKCKRQRRLRKQRLERRKKQQTTRPLRGRQKGEGGARKGPQKKGPKAVKKGAARQKTGHRKVGGKRTTTRAPPSPAVVVTPTSGSD